MRLDPEDILVDGDKVVARARMTGTHKGELMGMPPTAKSVDVQLIDIIRSAMTVSRTSTGASSTRSRSCSNSVRSPTAHRRD